MEAQLPYSVYTPKLCRLSSLGYNWSPFCFGLDLAPWANRRLPLVNQTSPQAYLSSGEFARQSRLSHKALRLYNTMGLLSPAHVDETNGYRYYSKNQLERAKRIGLLRQLEMPLSIIAQILELEETEAAQHIGHWWQKEELRNREKRSLVHYLKDYLQGQGGTMYEVNTRTVPEQKVLAIQRRVYVKDLPNFIAEAFGSIQTYLATSGMNSDTVGWVIYHGQVNEDSDGPVEVCVPFEGRLEPKGEIAIRLEPAHQEAYTRISKSEVEFPHILKAYDAVSHWLSANNLPVLPNGCSPREVYFANWNTLGANDPACDIAFPYEVKS